MVWGRRQEGWFEALGPPLLVPSLQLALSIIVLCLNPASLSHPRALASFEYFDGHRLNALWERSHVILAAMAAGSML